MRNWATFAAVALFAVCSPPGAGGAEVRTWHTDSRFVDPSKAESGYNHPGSPPRPNALRVNVYLPNGYDPSSRRRYPVLFLLHGAGDAYDSWVLPGQGELMEIARGFRGIIVMPEADRGYYTNWWNGGRRGDPGWERYHLDELIPLVERRLPIRQKRRWHSIYGFSMGGMGAMFYASQRPHYFGSAGASQGTLSLQRPAFQAEPAFRAFIEQDPQAIFGDPQAQEFYWAGHNPTKLVANLINTRLYVAVGDGIPAEDENPGPGQLAELEVRMQSDEFVAAARDAGVDVTYRPQGGTHAWPSRRRHLTYAIREWGLFEPAVATPAAWTYKTVARLGRMWGFRFRFAEAPEEVNAFSLVADRLSGNGSGRVKIRAPGGCRFVATLPFERALPPDCRASARRRPLCEGRRPTVIGTSGNDVLRGTGKSDVIVARNGNDSVSGLGGNDRVCAGGGRDVVRGRKGKDRLVGQQGRDRLLGGPAGDRLEGGRGADTLIGGPGRDVLKGGRGTDDLSQ
ncbi:MAG: alpha/beta hydrolase-fold protein [Solirubrobacterales bacterium]